MVHLHVPPILFLRRIDSQSLIKGTWLPNLTRVVAFPSWRSRYLKNILETCSPAGRFCFDTRLCNPYECPIEDDIFKYFTSHDREDIYWKMKAEEYYGHGRFQCTFSVPFHLSQIIIPTIPNRCRRWSI